MNDTPANAQFRAEMIAEIMTRSNPAQPTRYKLHLEKQTDEWLARRINAIKEDAARGRNGIYKTYATILKCP